MTGTLLHALGSARPGGAEAFFDRLLVGLAARGLPQVAVVRRHPEREALLRKAGIPTYGFGFHNPYDLLTRYRIRRAARRHGARMLLAWMSRAAVLAPDPGRDTVLAARLGGYYKLKYFRRCSVMVANTRQLCDYIVAGGWSRERVYYLPNFVAADREPPLDRSALGVPEDVPLLLALGRLHRDKGFDLLLAALARLPAETHLLLGGVGPEGAALEAQAAALGVASRVRFLGWRPDVAALFATADVFVCSSRLEPLGNIVIEAWAHGVPVVAVDSPGPRELITPETEGLITPAEDPAALAAAVARVLSEPALGRALAAAGDRRFRHEFCEDAVVPQYLDFIAQVGGVCAA